MASKKATVADNQQVTRRISNEYLAGFADGEGCFYIGFSKRKDLPLKWQIITEFHLSQNPGGKNILEEFKKRLKCGYLKLNHAKSRKDKSWVLVIKDRKDLREKLLPFFKQHPIHTIKQKEYLVFGKVLNLINQRKHLSKDGFKKIVNLVFDLGRTTKKRYSKEILLS